MTSAREVAFPYENAQVRERLGVDTLEKVLLIDGEWRPGRTTVVLVREPVGVRAPASSDAEGGRLAKERPVGLDRLP